MRGKKESCYWMMISEDKYELPLAVANTREELAQLCGVKAVSISGLMSHAKKKGVKCRYIKVPKEK